jgi:hypothetical protein
MQFWSVNVDPKYLNFATFSKDLLATDSLYDLQFKTMAFFNKTIVSSVMKLISCNWFLLCNFLWHSISLTKWFDILYLFYWPMVLQSMEPLWILDPSYSTHFPATSLTVQFAGVSAQIVGINSPNSHTISIITATNEHNSFVDFLCKDEGILGSTILDTASWYIDYTLASWSPHKLSWLSIVFFIHAEGCRSSTLKEATAAFSNILLPFHKAPYHFIWPYMASAVDRMPLNNLHALQAFSKLNV